MKGIIFDIQKFSIHDGPGIRTTVFFKGCNNRCSWCHNPESFSIKPELRMFPERCIGCNRCFDTCPQGVFDIIGNTRVLYRERCKACGLCAKTCFANALEIVGKSMSPVQVLDEIMKDKIYYDSSNGGVTFSGGEPILQKEFLGVLLKLCKKNALHTTVQTAGNYDWSDIENLLSYIDLVMYDVKAYSNEIYFQHIGNGKKKIFDNLINLSKRNIDLIVRTPIIAGVNDDADEIANITRVIKDFKRLVYYELIPYHKLGISKYKSIGMDYGFKFEAPSQEKMDELAHIASKYVRDVRYKKDNKVKQL